MDLSKFNGYYCYDVFNNQAGKNGDLRIHVISFKNEKDALEFADGRDNLSVEVGKYIFTDKKHE